MQTCDSVARSTSDRRERKAENMRYATGVMARRMTEREALLEDADYANETAEGDPTDLDIEWSARDAERLACEAMSWVESAEWERWQS